MIQSPVSPWCLTTVRVSESLVQTRYSASMINRFEVCSCAQLGASLCLRGTVQYSTYWGSCSQCRQHQWSNHFYHSPVACQDDNRPIGGLALTGWRHWTKICEMKGALHGFGLVSLQNVWGLNRQSPRTQLCVLCLPMQSTLGCDRSMA